MVAVTGANGLLGSFIVRELLASGKEVIAIRRPASDTSLLNDLTNEIQWRTADVTDPVALREAFDGVTSVIHAAALVSFNPAHAKQIMKTNVEGTRNVVNACLQQQIKRLVHISSVSALGRQKGQTLIDEKNKWIESSSNSVYGESKYRAELEVFRGHEEGLDTVIINPSVILAPADWNKSSAKLFKYVWDQRPYYIGGSLNYVDVRDVASVSVKFLELPVRAERFIVNASTVPFIDFFTMIASRFNKRPPSIKVGRPLLSILANMEILRSRMLQNEPLITKETARLANTHFTYNNEKLRNTLNFSFKPIESTLAWCCDYYLNYLGKK
jgi:dihydroflavonol-4-reductase